MKGLGTGYVERQVFAPPRGRNRRSKNATAPNVPRRRCRRGPDPSGSQFNVVERARECLAQCEAQFDADEDRHRLAQSHAWNESPLRGGLDRFLIEAECRASSPILCRCCSNRNGTSTACASSIRTYRCRADESAVRRGVAAPARNLNPRSDAPAADRSFKPSRLRLIRRSIRYAL